MANFAYNSSMNKKTVPLGAVFTYISASLSIIKKTLHDY